MYHPVFTLNIDEQFKYSTAPGSKSQVQGTKPFCSISDTVPEKRLRNYYSLARAALCRAFFGKTGMQSAIYRCNQLNTVTFNKI